MALNVALTSSGEPVAEAGEYFLCRRHNMRFKLVTKVSGRKTTTKAKGVLFLTTHRLVFINENRRQEVQSFSAPILTITQEKFHQPIFGANYLSGVVPVPSSGGEGTFNLTFNSGGFGTFLQLFYALMDKYRSASDAARQQLYTEVRDGKFMKAQQAYFDPRDPSHVYIEQPDFVVKSDGKSAAAPAPAPAPAPAVAVAATPSGPSGAGGGAGAQQASGADPPGATPTAPPAPPGMNTRSDNKW